MLHAQLSQRLDLLAVRRYSLDAVARRLRCFLHLRQHVRLASAGQSLHADKAMRRGEYQAGRRQLARLEFFVRKSSLGRVDLQDRGDLVSALSFDLQDPLFTLAGGLRGVAGTGQDIFTPRDGLANLLLGKPLVHATFHEALTIAARDMPAPSRSLA